MKTISYKGILDDGGQDRIQLATKTGQTGYKIVKFEIMPNQPGKFRGEHIVKVYTKKQEIIDEVVNFTDDSLLAAGIVTNQTDANDSYSQVISFDNQIFNQDIFITHFEDTSNKPCNYYIELEQIKLSDVEATMATLKDLRSISA